MAGWQPAQGGVLLYMPAARVSIEEAQQSLSELSITDDTTLRAESQLSQISDTIVPSCEHKASVQIKSEPIEGDDFVFLEESSPETLVCKSDDSEIIVDAEVIVPTPVASSTSPDLLTQLRNAAGNQCPADFAVSPKRSPSLGSTLTVEDFVHVGYESEPTDFDESPSPSMHKSNKAAKRSTRATSRYYKSHAKASNTKQSPIRPLNFGSKVQKRPVKDKKKSASAIALETLRNIEQAPPHKWDEQERELLCILNRWYCASNRAEELHVFASVFNSMTGLDLKPIRIRNQFESHLRLFGVEAYHEYGRVFSIPFDDPGHRYREVRLLIEDEAQALGLNIQQRQSDTNITSGRAKFAKSPRTRNIYKSLVEKASQKAKKEAVQEETVARNVPSGSGFTIAAAVTTPLEDEWEMITDIETSPQAMSNDIEVYKTAVAKPNLVFRVWDEANRTKFINGSFVAQAFIDWPRPFPPPLALEDPSAAGKILALLHLSKHGDTPVFISTASSLIQALSYATNMQQPRIALINLKAPCLQEEHKIHHAADIFPWLKSQGLARWARYRGNGEYIIWSEIPSEAVLHTISLTGLVKDLNSDVDCHSLLSFDVFQPGTKTRAIAATLRERNIMLNTEVASALGKTAKAFGMSSSNVTLQHLRDFVARLVDGWTITKADTIDMHTMSSLAATFALALGTHHGGYTFQEVIRALIEGIDDGVRCSAHWSKSRSGSRRQRFREG